MKNFKFLQKNKKERVFMDFMDALDDYHLGGIPMRRINNPVLNSFSYPQSHINDNNMNIVFVWLCNDNFNWEYRLMTYIGSVGNFYIEYEHHKNMMDNDSNNSDYCPHIPRLHSFEYIDSNGTFRSLSNGDINLLNRNENVNITYKVYTR